MYYVRLVDDNGFFIEDAFVKNLTTNTIETPCIGQFYKPKWDGIEWKEGLTQIEINAIENEVAPKTEIEELQSQIVATQMLIIENEAFV